MFVVDFYCLQLKGSQGGHLPLMQWEWHWNLSPVLSNSQSSFSGPCAPGCTGISPRLDSRGQNRQCPCHVILTAVWSIISLQPHFESKNPLGEKIPPPPKRQGFSGGGGTRERQEEPHTPETFREIMPYVMFELYPSGLIGAFCRCKKSQPKCSLSNRRTWAMCTVEEKMMQGW